MPKVTITFDCPEENVELRQALDGAAWEAVVCDIDQHLRSIEKYDCNKPDAVREFAYDLRQTICNEFMDGLTFSP